MFFIVLATTLILEIVGGTLIYKGDYVLGIVLIATGLGIGVMYQIHRSKRKKSKAKKGEEESSSSSSCDVFDCVDCIDLKPSGKSLDCDGFDCTPDCSP